MRAGVSGLRWGLSLSTGDTVCCDPPASRATSAIAAARAVRGRRAPGGVAGLAMAAAMLTLTPNPSKRHALAYTGRCRERSHAVHYRAAPPMRISPHARLRPLAPG